MKTLIKLLCAVGLLASCSGGSGEKLLGYQEIEKKVYDMPAKSQVIYRAYLTDTIYTPEQLTKLVNKFVSDCKYEPVKFHSEPTHIFVYLYAKPGDCEADGSNWIAMYSKDYGVEIKSK
jgi:hypothetical protein